MLSNLDTELNVSVNQKVFAGTNIELRPVSHWDLPSLRRWRNSPEISRQMIDTSYITPSQQRKWFEKINGRPDQAHWVVWVRGNRAGYMNIKGSGPLELQDCVDVGTYVINTKVKYVLLGYTIALMQLQIVFEHLNISRIETKVRQDNTRALIHAKHFGYVRNGVKDGLVSVTLSRNSYWDTKSKFEKLLHRA